MVAPLARGPWLLGDTFTAADISCGYALGIGSFLHLEDKLDPVLRAYLGRIRERPAFQRAQAHGQPVSPPPEVTAAAAAPAQACAAAPP